LTFDIQVQSFEEEMQPHNRATAGWAANAREADDARGDDEPQGLA
jgi:hypothetical protein